MKIKLTESQLKRLIKDIIKENFHDPRFSQDGDSSWNYQDQNVEGLYKKLIKQSDQELQKTLKLVRAMETDNGEITEPFITWSESLFGDEVDLTPENYKQEIESAVNEYADLLDKYDL